MAQVTVRVDSTTLTDFVRDLFVRAGLPEPDAGTVADVLVWANLRGVASHGVLRIPNYLNRVASGVFNPHPEIRVDPEGAAFFIQDSDHAMGAVAMTQAMGLAIEKARDAGVCWGLVRHTTHMGAIGYYTLAAARAGMAGMVMASSTPNMAYHGARAAGVATSPIAISVPGGEHAPLNFDMATSVISIGALAHARDSGEALAEGLALDGAGNPTTNSANAVLPLPVGGAKGSGLALMFECLSGLMVGSPILAPMLEGPPAGDNHRQNAVVVAIDIAAFTDLAGYRANVDGLVAQIKALPKAAGVSEILVPGERGDRLLAERQSYGIPIAGGTWRRLADAASNLGVDMPPVL